MVGTDQKTDACPETYLTPAYIARTLGNHPSAAVRWMRRGALLSDGSRLFLRYVALPGGYRVKQEWLDEFLETLTADRSRAGKPEGTAKAAPMSKRVAKMRAELAEAGFR
jgi:hypothetical protein